MTMRKTTNVMRLMAALVLSLTFLTLSAQHYMGTGNKAQEALSSPPSINAETNYLKGIGIVEPGSQNPYFSINRSVVFYESFDATTFPPTGWTRTQLGAGTVNWARTTTTYSGAGAAWHAFNESANPNSWLVTPAIVLEAGKNYILSFFERNQYVPTWYGYSGVLISEGNGNAGHSDFQEVYESNVNRPSYTEKTIPISGGAGKTIYIAFVYQGLDAHNWWVDEVSVTEIVQNDFNVLSVSTNNYLNKVDVQIPVSAIVRNDGTLAQSKTVTFKANGNTIGTANTAILNQGDQETVSVNWTPTIPDLYTITAEVPDDENNLNNSKQTSIAVTSSDMLSEGFEGNFLPLFWSETGNQQNWLTTNAAHLLIHGSWSAFIAQQSIHPEEMLITPELELDGSWTTLSYWTRGLNNVFGYGSTTLQMKYRDASAKGEWINFGDPEDYAITGDELRYVELDLTGLPGGIYQFAFATTSTFNYSTFYSGFSIDGVVGPAIFMGPCAPPTSLGTQVFSSTSAQAGWNPGGSETAWELEYGLAGFAQGSGTVVPVSGSPRYTFTGLNEGQTYSWYVRADCGAEYSYWAGPSTFALLCDVGCPDGAIAELEPCGESWNDGCNTATPAFETVNCGDIICGTLWALGGNRDTDWFELVLTEHTQVVLHANADEPTLIFHLNVPPDCTGVTIIQQVQAGRCAPVSMDVGVLAPGTHYFWAGLPVFDGFPCEVGYWIEFECNTSCLPVSDLTATPLNTTNAQLDWNFFGAASQWEVAVVDAGDPEPTTGTLVATNTFTATGLSVGSSYDAYVRTVCGEKSVSSWISVSFTMAYCPAGPTTAADSDLFRVQITGPGVNFDHNVGCTGVLGAQDFTGLGAITLQQGVEYLMTLTMGQCGTGAYTNVGKAWIDFNQNLQWAEPEERLGVVQGATSPTGIAYSFNFTVSSGAQLGETRMRVMQWETTVQESVIPCATFSWGSVHDYLVEIALPPDCPPPVDLTTISTNADGAEVAWTSTAGEFEIEYGLAPYTFTETANVTGIFANSHPFTGLDPETTYQYKVKAICGVGDESEWSAMGSFTTDCLPIDLPWCENFDGVTAPAIPVCMTVTNDNNDAYQWATYTTNPYSAPNAMSILYNEFLPSDDWFFSPGLNLEAGVEYQVEFYYRAQSSGFPEALKVMWGSSPAAAGMTGGTIWNNGSITNTAYQLASGVFTPDVTGVYYIGWHAYSDADMWRLYVDDICVDIRRYPVTFNVDITTIDGFDPDVTDIYMAGTFPGATWDTPGSNDDLLMQPGAVTDVYTLTLNLPAGYYEYKYFRVFDEATWNNGEYQGGDNRSIVVDDEVSTCDVFGGTIAWANLQWPGAESITEGGSYDVYGQVHIPLVTNDPSLGYIYILEAWVGISDEDTDPSGWDNWMQATFNGKAGGNDEYVADIAGGLEPGIYYYAYRYRFGQICGSYLYGGYNGGFWDGVDNVSGILTVNPSGPPSYRFVDGAVDDCLDAQDEVEIDGATVETGAIADIRSGGIITATDFEVKDGGTAYLTAQTSITLGVDVLITPGASGFFLAKIDNFTPCSLPLSMIAAEDVIIPEELPVIAKSESFFKVYPNPTTGNFNIELTGAEQASKTHVEIYSMMGERVFRSEPEGAMLYEFNISAMPRGIYIIRVINGEEMGAVRLIKQ